MIALFSRKITSFKITLLLSIALIAIFYNFKLFTVEDNDNEKIALKDIYLKWDERTTQISEVNQVLRQAKLEKRVSALQSSQIKQSVSQESDESQSTFKIDRVNYFENRKQFSGKIESIHDIQVEKDRLVHVQFIQAAANGDELATEETMQYRIEYWKSPINFTGYKKDKNKIILYGIEDIDKVNFKFADDKMCLEYGDKYFEIEETQEFKQFYPISDENFIAILIKDEP